MEKIRILRTLAYISDSSIDIGVTTQSLEKMSFMLLSCQYQHKKTKTKKNLDIFAWFYKELQIIG